MAAADWVFNHVIAADEAIPPIERQGFRPGVTPHDATALPGYMVESRLQDSRAQPTAPRAVSDSHAEQVPRGSIGSAAMGFPPHFNTSSDDLRAGVDSKVAVAGSLPERVILPRGGAAPQDLSAQRERR